MNMITKIIPYYLIGLGILVICSCGSQKVHVTTWDDAFFLPDGNIGVVGWEYDEVSPNGAWDYPEWSNINQYLYSYNRQTEELTLIAQLAENVWAFPAYPGACRLGNWIAYETVIEGNRSSAVGVYDLEQQKISYIVGVETGASLPLQGISTDGKVLFVENGGRGLAFDAVVREKILEGRNIVPFYIDNSYIFTFAYKPYVASLDTAWIIRSSPGNVASPDTLQVLPQWRIGRITSDGKYLLCGISINSSGRGCPFTGILLDSLANGVFKYDTVSGINDYFTSKGDYNGSTGDFVYYDHGSIYFGNANASTIPMKILSQITTQR